MATFKERHAKHYCNVKTSRGLNYHFLAIPALVNKPTLLFLHGFPSQASDWHYQIEHFHSKGYGVVAPDLLGYGGTDKPTDLSLFKWKDMSKDVIDILDSLDWIKDTPVISISHDWGGGLNGRIAFYYPERFRAFVFTSVGPLQFTQGPFNFEVVLPILKNAFGYEVLAYQKYFAQDPEAAQTIETNIDSFIDLLFPESPALWKDVLGVSGGTKEWLASNKRGPRAAWLTEGDAAATRASLTAGGLSAPLNWYKLFAEGINKEDDATLVGKKIEKPLLYIGATGDAVCPIPVHKGYAYELGTKASDISFDTGHWVMLEQPERFNSELEKFVETVLA